MHKLKPALISLCIATAFGFSHLWTSLLGLWAAYDTPVLIWAKGVGLDVMVVSHLSLALFSAITAVLAAVLIRRFCPTESHSIFSAMFGLAALLIFIVPVAFGGEWPVILEFYPLWLFVAFFASATVILSRFCSKRAAHV